jgi:hypothetical protein
VDPGGGGDRDVRVSEERVGDEMVNAGGEEVDELEADCVDLLDVDLIRQFVGV